MAKMTNNSNIKDYINIIEIGKLSIVPKSEPAPIAPDRTKHITNYISDVVKSNKISIESLKSEPVPIEPDQTNHITNYISDVVKPNKISIESLKSDINELSVKIHNGPISIDLLKSDVNDLSGKIIEIKELLLTIDRSKEEFYREYLTTLQEIKTLPMVTESSKEKFYQDLLSKLNEIGSNPVTNNNTTLQEEISLKLSEIRSNSDDSIHLSTYLDKLSESNSMIVNAIKEISSNITYIQPTNIELFENILLNQQNMSDNQQILFANQESMISTQLSIIESQTVIGTMFDRLLEKISDIKSTPVELSPIFQIPESIKRVTKLVERDENGLITKIIEQSEPTNSTSYP